MLISNMCKGLVEGEHAFIKHVSLNDTGREMVKFSSSPCLTEPITGKFYFEFEVEFSSDLFFCWNFGELNDLCILSFPRFHLNNGNGLKFPIFILNNTILFKGIISFCEMPQKGVYLTDSVGLNFAVAKVKLSPERKVPTLNLLGGRLSPKFIKIALNHKITFNFKENANEKIMRILLLIEFKLMPFDPGGCTGIS